MWGPWLGEGSAFSGKLIFKLMSGQYQLKKEVKESRNNVCKWCLFCCLNDVYVLPSLPWNSDKWLYWDPGLCYSAYWLHCVSGTNYRRLVSRSELRIDFLDVLRPLHQNRPYLIIFSLLRIGSFLAEYQDCPHQWLKSNKSPLYGSLIGRFYSFISAINRYFFWLVCMYSGIVWQKYLSWDYMVINVFDIDLEN